MALIDSTGTASLFGMLAGMNRKRAVALIAAALCAGLIWASPIGNFIGLFLYVGLYQSLYPSTISWDSKIAYVKCAGAIADPRTWPASPSAACEAMYLCANEAQLKEEQRKALYEHIRTTPGCQQP
jgi:hypothetical protein